MINIKHLDSDRENHLLCVYDKNRLHVFSPFKITDDQYLDYGYHAGRVVWERILDGRREGN